MSKLALNLADIFQVDLRRRWTEEAPHSALATMFAANQEAYVKTLEGFTRDCEAMEKIAMQSAPDSLEPSWNNEWFSGLDGISLYGYVQRLKPRLYLEIGSGNSTMFARRAIRDHNLPTRIVSIDPKPRADIDSICDEVLRQRLEHVDYKNVFSQLAAGDIVFFDGSHRSFQNSDVTVFFTEILPMLPSGIMIGIHDIFLPADYVQAFTGRFYSEQYLLACWLLADNGQQLRVELPVYWICSAQEAGPSRDAILPLYKKLPAGVPTGGGAFWLSKK